MDVTKLSENDLFALYWKMRDQREHHELELERFKAAEQKVLDIMAARWPYNESDQVKGYKHSTGTFMYTRRSFVNVKKGEFDKFLEWVITHGKYDFLKRAASTKPVEEYIVSKQDMPPGIDYGTIASASVRKPSDKVIDND